MWNVPYCIWTCIRRDYIWLAFCVCVCVCVSQLLDSSFCISIVLSLCHTAIWFLSLCYFEGRTTQLCSVCVCVCARAHVGIRNDHYIRMWALFISTEHVSRVPRPHTKTNVFICLLCVFKRWVSKSVNFFFARWTWDEILLNRAPYFFIKWVWFVTVKCILTCKNTLNVI